MEEAAELTNDLPLSFKSRSEQDYIAFLWDACIFRAIPASHSDGSRPAIPT